MKRLIAICMTILVVAGITTAPYADPFSTGKQINMTVQVASIFGFSLWDAELSQAASINPGEPAFFDLHMTCVSNRSIPWVINAASAGMNTVPPDVTLPVAASTFSALDTGSPNRPHGTFFTDVVLSTSPTPIYQSGYGEAPGGCVVNGLLVVGTDTSTPAGTYMGYVTLTMTD